MNATKLWFGERLKIVHESKKAKGVKWIEIKDTLTNGCIVSVRGTHNSQDYLEDAQIWMLVATLQLTSSIGPFASLWPEWALRYFVRGASRLSMPHSSSLTYYYPLDTHIEKMKRDNCTFIVLTGHSLGGGLAKIVGGKQHLDSITFSSPGIYYTGSKWGVNVPLENQKQQVTIMPEFDMRIHFVLFMKEKMDFLCFLLLLHCVLFLW